MHERFAEALALGSEHIVAWADVLDKINVFPVPDGDTGRNLVISLAPLKKKNGNLQDLIRALLMNARGNSGNIMARFMSGFLTANDLSGLPHSCRKGRDLAYQAVPDPKPGTMFTFFDVLVDSIEKNPQDPQGLWVERVMEDLEEAVRLTASQLEELKRAGVVDAGALGMFVFFDSCLKAMAGFEPTPVGIVEKFKGYLTLADSFEATSNGICVDTLLKVDDRKAVPPELSSLGESMMTIAQGDFLKVHLHAGNSSEVREMLSGIGQIVTWAEDDLADQSRRLARMGLKQAIHIMTDAAGSMTRTDAAELNVTLLDSYVTVGDFCLPETYHDPLFVLNAMRKGIKVSTSRPSVFEQRQHYQKVQSLYPRVLYLCVGSVYTGNYQSVMDWKKGYDPQDMLIVIDTGCASGRLGLAARAVAEFALATDDPEAVILYAGRVIEKCREYIFLNKLQYLAAGGRISKTGAFFGDVLHVKPIVSPTPQGVVKAGTARNTKDQIAFAFSRLEQGAFNDPKAVIMLEYTDNKDWVKEKVGRLVRERYPECRIILQPVSLTSSTHMGPGTWGMAFLPGITSE
jgi:DegV family protein with EDD domain